jgi:parallel beta-helix repeat protein
VVNKFEQKEEPMIRSLLLFISALLLSACPAMAKTFYVGECHAGGFLSVSDAVKSVPEGSVIDVCPGSQVGQVIISKSLTLQGLTLNNSNEEHIVCCTQGTATDAESQVLGLDFVPTIWVTAGTVNISNLEIDIDSGPGSSSGCSQLPTGIFYGSGTSGTVNHVVIAVKAKNCGVGIAAENATVDDSFIKIENSYITTDNFGILMGSLQPEGVLPVLSNTITGNTITSSTHGILLLLSRGKVSGNNIAITAKNTQQSYGILEAAPATTITDNMISIGLGTGVIIDGASATVTGNKINGSVGVDLGCTAETVTNNTIYANVGLDHVLATFAGKNTFLSTYTFVNRICEDAEPRLERAFSPLDIRDGTYGTKP